MPGGELFALAAALTFAFTAIADKILIRRFRPLTLVSLSSMGGALFAVTLLFALGKAQEVANAPVGFVLLSAVGSIISVGIGFPLYLMFLRSVAVSRAAPLSTGLYSLLGVLSGIILLEEDLSPLNLVGVSLILTGVYLLSISQRRHTEAKEARWLGVKGIVFLVFVASLWVAGSSLQRIAVKEVDLFIIQAARVSAVFFVVSALASPGLVLLLGRQGPEASPPATRGPTSPARQRPSRHGSSKDLFPRMARGSGRRSRRRVELQIQPPVDWSRVRELEEELSRVQATLHHGDSEDSGGGVQLYMDLPQSFSPEAILAAMPAVAVARRVGHWPGSHGIELTLRSPEEGITRKPGRSMLPPRIREVKLEGFALLPFLLPVVNGIASFGVASLLMLAAFQRVGLAITVVLISTELLWVALLSAIFLRERLTPKTIAGVVATVTGVILVVL